MKQLLILLALSLSLSAFAEQKREFLHRSDCDDNHGHESRISDIHKISESETSVSFSLVLSYSTCDNIEMFPGPIKTQKGMVQVGDYGFSYPFKKKYAKVVNFNALSETETQAEISIDKSVFASKNSRKFLFDFWAQDYLGFPWILKAKNINGSVEISFEGFKRL